MVIGADASSLAGLGALLLPRRLPLVATSGRVIQAYRDALAGERVVERWVRYLSCDVRVLLAVRLALPDAWVQVGTVAGPCWSVELWHQPQSASAGVTRAAEVLRRSVHLFADRDAAVAAARGESDRLGVSYREVR